MDVMVDIECMALTEDAAVIQIAAVQFEPVLGGKVVICDSFNTGIKLVGQARYVDPDTLLWWLTQGERARGVMMDCLGNGIGLEQALMLFHSWYEQRKPRCVWSHGAAYDIPVLQNAYRQYGQEPPWGYRDVRDTRTLFMALKDPDIDLPENLAHDAIQDAVHQAKCVQRAFR